jgi:ribosomal protein S18 acetylase RimI-like enzyme
MCERILAKGVLCNFGRSLAGSAVVCHRSWPPPGYASTEVEIRELGPGDEELVDRAARRFRDQPAAAPDLFLEDPRSHLLVALDGDEVLGWAYGYELLRPEGRWMMFMQQIDVVADRRREGIGRALLDRFVAVARSKGHQKMWLYVDAGGVAARGLYEDAVTDGSEKLGVWWVFG